MKKLLAIVTFAFAGFVFAASASAQVLINEIMYDLEGADSGREWIEIKNTSGQSVDLIDWKFFENATNHGLTFYQGGQSLAAGEYAVIVDKPDLFLADWPSYQGIILDSSTFSLSNSGETFSLRDAQGNDIDSVAYTSDWGAGGDRNSLQKISASWQAAVPTPGKSNQGQTSTEGGSTSQSASSANTTAAFSQIETVVLSAGGGISELTLSLGKDRLAAAGIPVELRAQVTAQGREISGANVSWSFGDGSVGQGIEVSHTYEYPGKYATVARVSYGIAETLGRLIVNVVPLSLEVAAQDGESGYVKITNNSTSELHFGGLRVLSGGQNFVLPKDTILLPKSTIAVSSKTLGFKIKPEAALILPDGKLAAASVAGRVLGEYQGGSREELLELVRDELSIIKNRLADLVAALRRLESQ